MIGIRQLGFGQNTASPNHIVRPRSKLLYAFVALWILVPGAHTGAQDDNAVFCPVLPPNTALHWRPTHGIDFQVCSASIQGSSEVGFGVYLGSWPGFNRTTPW